MVDDHYAPPAEAASDSERQITRARGLQHAARFTALAGIVYAVLFVTSFGLLTDIPKMGSTDQEIVTFYASDKGSAVTIVALYLMPFSGIAFLWFIVSLRMWTSTRVERPVNVLFSNIQLASGIIFLALFFCAAAALSMTAIAIDVGNQEIIPAVAREFPQFGGSLFFVFAARMGAMFVFTTTNIGRSTKILPNWFVVVGIIVGLTMLLSASFNRSLIFMFPVWVLMLCVIILLHARRVASTDPPREIPVGS